MVGFAVCVWNVVGNDACVGVVRLRHQRIGRVVTTRGVRGCRRMAKGVVASAASLEDVERQLREYLEDADDGDRQGAIPRYKDLIAQGRAQLVEDLMAYGGITRVYRRMYPEREELSNESEIDEGARVAESSWSPEESQAGFIRLGFSRDESLTEDKIREAFERAKDRPRFVPAQQVESHREEDVTRRGLDRFSLKQAVARRPTESLYLTWVERVGVCSFATIVAIYLKFGDSLVAEAFLVAKAIEHMIAAAWALRLAKEKGRNGVTWFVRAGASGLLGVRVLQQLPSLES